MNFLVCYKTVAGAVNLWVQYKNLQSAIDFAIAFSGRSDKKISVFEDGKKTPSFIKWNFIKKEA